MAQTQTGTPYYSAPEVWEEVPYNHKSDIWSLGVLTYEMTCLTVPFDSDNVIGLMNRITEGDY